MTKPIFSNIVMEAWKQSPSLKRLQKMLFYFEDSSNWKQQTGFFQVIH